MGSNHQSLVPPALERQYDGRNVDAPAHTDPPSSQRRIPAKHSSATRWGALLFALVLVIVLAILFLHGMHARHEAAQTLQQDVQQESNAPLAVDVVHVEVAPAQTTLTLPGEAQSFYQTTIFARTSGYIGKWFSDIGDHVKAGQVLATIETPELDDELKAAQAKLNELKAEVGVAETNMKFAQISFDRWKPLAAQGAVAAQDRDQKEAELNSSKAKWEAAKAQVALGQADIDRLQTLEAFKNVTAPFDGVITERHIDFGALVTAGSTSSTTPLYSISQQDTIRLFVDVPQASAFLIKVGMSVKANTREYPGRIFLGRVDRTSSAIDPKSKMLHVEVLVPNKDSALLPGMFMQVHLENDRAHPPLRVEAGALCFRPDGTNLAVVGNDDRVSMRNVEITRDMGQFVEVQGDINPGALVALNIGSNVHTGDRVNPHDADAQEVSSPATRPGAEADARLPKNLHADDAH